MFSFGRGGAGRPRSPQHPRVPVRALRRTDHRPLHDRPAPETGEELGVDDLVEVGPNGEVTTWAWVSHPHEKHPLDRPFAWALIGLDGADTALLHVVDAGDESRMRTGMRVKPRWREERVGDIHDVEAFVPEEQ